MQQIQNEKLQKQIISMHIEIYQQIQNGYFRMCVCEREPDDTPESRRANSDAVVSKLNLVE